MPYADPIKRAECRQRWALANPDKDRAAKKKWKENNPEKVREQARIDAARHRERYPEQVLKRNRAFYNANKEAINKRRREAGPEEKAKRRGLWHKNKYGITLEEREVLFESQGRCCASCSGTEPGHKLGWHLDHDHNTKKIRGILCHACNVALGQAKECPKRLRALADYIERHND